MSRTSTVFALAFGIFFAAAPALAQDSADDPVPSEPPDVEGEEQPEGKMCTHCGEHHAKHRKHHGEAGMCPHCGHGHAASAHAAEHDNGGRPASMGRRFDISLDGYVRGEYSTFTPRRLFGVRMPAHDDNAPDIGKNDGFALGGARLNLRARYGDALYIRLGFDGSTVAYGSREDVTGDLTTGLKDAYFRYAFSPAATLSVGRFKPPFDVEELTPTEDQYFVRRSLESRGILRHEGRGAGDSLGFAPGRQIGMMLGAPKVIDTDAMSLGYAVALTNGNGRDSALNDNDLPALWARVTLGFGMERIKGRVADEEGPATYGITDGILVGLGGGFNQVTTGTAPTRQNDRELSGGLDVAAHFGPVVARGQVLYARVEHLDVERAPTEAALGGHLQVSFLIPDLDLAPGVRYAYYDPRVISDDELGSADFDRVQHVTAGLRWSPEGMPVVGLLDYTHSIEQAQRVVNNDRVELSLQVNFE